MTPMPVLPDREVAYRAVASRDPRFDGRLFVGVLSTGIYCRPSCPSRTPKPAHCSYFSTSAACVAAGFRACRRCRPDALPGSPDWDVDADLAGRALRLVADGVVDDDGVAGLARRLSVSPRHLHRVLVGQLGASPVQLAQTRRAQVARMLLEQSDWPMSDVAFAAGFRSIRQFNDVMRAHLGASPSTLRASGTRVSGARVSRARVSGARVSRARVSGTRVSGARVSGARVSGARASVAGPSAPGAGVSASGALTLQLRHRVPLDGEAWLAHVAARAVPGLEAVAGGRVRRVVVVGRGPALVELVVGVPAAGDRVAGGRVAGGRAGGQHEVTAHLTLASLADLTRVVGRLRHWADLDADPQRVDAVLGADPLLAPLVAARPGLRVPGTLDPAELVLRTVVGQQVSVAAARTFAARLVAELGEPTEWGLRRFPTPAEVADAGPDTLRAIGLTTARAATLHAVARLLADGLPVGPGVDRELVRAELLQVRGVGPWTADYVAMRALGDPDAFPADDLVLRRALGGVSARDALRLAEAWRPWRAYAAQHLWTHAAATARSGAAPSGRAPAAHHPIEEDS